MRIDEESLSSYFDYIYNLPSVQKVNDLKAYIVNDDGDVVGQIHADSLASNVAQEVSKMCFFRPMYPDGSFVQEGDFLFDGDALIGPVDCTSYYSEGNCDIKSGNDVIEYHVGDELNKYSDTQSKIFADLSLSAIDYAKKHKIPNMTNLLESDQLEARVRCDIISRQKILDKTEEMKKYR